MTDPQDLPSVPPDQDLPSLPAPTGAGETVASPEGPSAAEVAPTQVASDGVEAAADVRAGQPADDVRGTRGAPGDSPSPAEIVPVLVARFPALFGAAVPKPLKLRIQADIQQRAPGTFTRKALSAFLHRHTTSTAYLKALVAAETRFDLDGAPAGEIAAEHREAAAAELARRRAIVQARRQGAGPGAGRGKRPDAAPNPPGASPAGPAAPPPRGGGPGPGRDAEVMSSVDSPRPRPARPGRDARVRHETGTQAGAGSASRHAAHTGADRAAARPTSRGGGNDGSARGDRPGLRTPPGAVKQTNTRPPVAGAGRTDNRPAAADARRIGQRPATADGFPAAAPTEPAWPTDEAQRARAMLLRAWETSPLAKANFCVLKRLSEADFDAQIAQARAERAARGRGGGDAA